MKVLITSNSFGKFDSKPRELMESLGWEVVGNRYHHIMNEEEMMCSTWCRRNHPWFRHS